jgi:hypothetical protein
MAHTTTIADLIDAGVAIEPHEAVALVLELIQNPTCDPPEPPFGPPSLANVYLEADGSVACRACEATPAVSEIAILLQRLLGDTPQRAPGGLRYAIARALLEVDAPPFDSVNDFAVVLGRFERGDREQVLRGLFARVSTYSQLATVTKFRTMMDRRQLMPSATDLRRELRKVDEQLYAHHRRATDVIPPIPSIPAMPAIPAVVVQARQPRGVNAVAAGIAVGLVLAGSGELLHIRTHGPRDTRSAAVVTPATGTAKAAPSAPAAADAARAVPSSATDAAAAPALVRFSGAAVPELADEPDAPAVVRRPPVSQAASAVRADRRVTAGADSSRKRASSVRHATRSRQTQEHGVLKHLRLQWLKNVFSSRS